MVVLERSGAVTVECPCGESCSGDQQTIFDWLNEHALHCIKAAKLRLAKAS